MPNPREILAPILKFQGKKAELSLTPAQAKTAQQALGKNFKASEAICVFNFLDLVKGAGQGQEVETAHMENLYEYCNLDAVQEGFEAGTLLPFAVLNILGDIYPDQNTFQETSNHGLLCLDFSAGDPKVVWVYGGELRSFAASPKELAIAAA